MNDCVPDWNFEGDFPVINQKKPMGPDHELVELIWRNGQVVLHSQTHKKPSPTINESRQVQKHDQPSSMCTGAFGDLSSLTEDDETVWIEYPLEDSFDKEFCSNFFTDLATSDPIVVDKESKKFEEEKSVRFSTSGASHVSSVQQPNIRPFVAPEVPRNTMPPPRFQFPDSVERIPSTGTVESLINFSNFATPLKGNIGSSNGQLGGKGSGHPTQGEVRECSVMTVGSSHSGSNQVPNNPDFGRVSSSGVGPSGLSTAPINYNLGKVIAQSERGQTETFEQTVTSSSGGSGSSFGRTGKQSTGVSDHKRKGRDVEESECQSEDAELESASRNKPAKRPGSSRRSRAAEVHNLSERRRRDRINEKMKILQELIPHSNKTDKASMLDEAIEYLKSLQLQLQVMWMGSRMAPVMFPGVQHYMSRMGIGMGPLPLQSMKNPLNFPRVPIIDQSISVAPTQNQPVTYQNSVSNPINYQNQMQNPSIPGQYAHYMNFHQMQTSLQPMNMFRFGSQTVQQSQAMAAASGSIGLFNSAPANSDTLGGKIS